MSKNADELVNRLNRVNFSGDAVPELWEIVDWAEAQPDAASFVAEFLRFIELTGNEDHGVPGPIVHFVEKYFRRGYEEQLLESCERRPTMMHVRMLKRMVNSTDGLERRRFEDSLERMALKSDGDVSSYAKKML